MYQKKTFLNLLLMVLSLAVYRVLPLSVQGFTPMIAVSIFAGAVIPDKKWAIALPLLCILLSDILFQFLYNKGMTTTAGFYNGQWINYVLFALLIVFGFAVKKINVKSVLLFSVSGSLMYFIASNFAVWATHTGFSRPMTFDGLMLCYADALAFYRDYGIIKGFTGNFILGDVIWSSLIFTAWFIVAKKAVPVKQVYINTDDLKPKTTTLIIKK
jgi:hypothetical protein